jgi:anthranilate 1,2-dioxygenase large subunit
MDGRPQESETLWPEADWSRVPYKAFVDPEIYAREQARIFRGPTWSYVALEAEIPQPGDFVVSAIGDVPIVVNRNAEGQLRAFVNRCAHRGAAVRRELRGRADTHICIYHQWCYDLNGDLQGVPFHRGVRGQGGMPEDFSFAQHGLQKVRVESYRGVIFGTVSEATPPLADYLGSPITSLLDRFFTRPIKILGRNRQVIPANWKLYAENTRDAYHAGLLHLFYATFGGFNPPKKGGITLSGEGVHCAIWAVSDLFTQETVKRITRPKGEAGGEKHRDRTFDAWLAGNEMQTAFQLADPASVIAGRQEFEDGIAVLIMSVFPGLVVQQIQNALAVRKLVMRGPEETELIWTHFGYADDDAEMDAIRLKHANIIGPAGFVSMEDGEVGRLIQTTVKSNHDGHSVLALGGTQAIDDTTHMISESSLRGFYRGYRRLMGFGAGGDG